MKNILVCNFRWLQLNRVFQYLLMFCVGVFILLLRNPDPIIHLVIYTEDGQWIGHALTHGWFDTFINAKNGYFVWGNIALLWASVTTSEVICNNALVCLPQAIAAYSYATFSVLAVLVYFSTQNIISSPLRLILFVLVLIIPLGDSANEIIGRISNVGYLAVLAAVLLFYCGDFYQSKWLKVLLVLLLIFLAGTNPVVIPVIGLSVLYKLAKSSNKYKVLNDNALLIIGMIFISFLIFFRMSEFSQSSVTGELQIANLIEVAIARSILYPFVFPVYSYLNDIVVIFLFILWLSLIFSFMKAKKRGNNKELLIYLLIALVVYLAFTLYARQSLTQQLGGYAVTFPDRYFMGLNLLVLVITFIAINGLLDIYGGGKKITIVVMVLLSSSYISHLFWLFEISVPRMVIQKGVDYSEQLCLSSVQNSPDIPTINIPIYFSGWVMTVPSSLVYEATRGLLCESYLNRPLDITDVNWAFGVARSWTGFVMLNTNSKIDTIPLNSDIKFSNGEIRKVIRKEVNGMYLNVFLSGEPLNMKTAGYPNNFEVLK